MVTLCGFVTIGIAVSRFYRSEKHRDASLYPRFGLDTFVYTIAMALAGKIRQKGGQFWSLEPRIP